MTFKSKYTRIAFSIALGAVAFQATTALATVTSRGQAATVVTLDQMLDSSFIFRSVLSVVAALLTWYINKLSNRVETLEKSQAQHANIELRIKNLEDMARASRQEEAQLQTQLNLLRERMMMEYHTKDEMREHNLALEKMLAELKDTLRTMNIKLETWQDRFYAQLNNQATGRRRNDEP